MESPSLTLTDTCWEAPLWMLWELQGTEQAELLSHKASFSSLQVGEIHAGQGGGTCCFISSSEASREKQFLRGTDPLFTLPALLGGGATGGRSPWVCLINPLYLRDPVTLSLRL